MRSIAVVGLLAASSAVFGLQETPETYSPAKFMGGKFPEQPPLASAGGITFLEIEVAPSGIVTDTTVLGEARPFTEALEEASTLWRFDPAREDGSAIASKVLVIGVFRPPVLLGTTVPEPAWVEEPSENVPYPIETSIPRYPPNALYDGVALVEVELDETGALVEAALLSPEHGFDEAALDATSEFRFRPAQHDGRPVPSFVLIFFGFRQPVTTPAIPKR